MAKAKITQHHDASVAGETSNVTPLIVTIDGPAGTGKSTVAYELAERLHLEFLDTGAMYRVAALVALEENIDPGHGRAIAKSLIARTMRFDWQGMPGRPPRVYLDDRDVSARIRMSDVDEIVSQVAKHSEVRELMVQEQRRLAEEHPRLVSEGRDQGSVVFPDAAVRFYLHADEEIRAARRIAQLKEKNLEVDERQVLEQIRIRDRTDTTRKDSPLVKPKGAVVIDTGPLSIQQVVEEMARVVQRKLNRPGSDQ